MDANRFKSFHHHLHCVMLILRGHAQIRARKEKENTLYYLITNLKYVRQVKERDDYGAWIDDIRSDECIFFWLPFIPKVKVCWYPKNKRQHEEGDDHWIKDIPPFREVDQKSLSNSRKEFLHQKTHHKGEYNPVWKGNKDNLVYCFNLSQ